MMFALRLDNTDLFLLTALFTSLNHFSSFTLIWGLYKVTTYNHYKYFLTIVDDYTRTTWTHLLSSKSNAFTFIKYFVALVKTQFNSKFQTVKTVKHWN